MNKPVVVVGAGLAGLVCARKLYQAGLSVIVVDGDDRPGGRLKTDNVGGFHLDRGFQVFFSAYPHARREFDLDALDLKAFKQGAYVGYGGDVHLVEPQSFGQKLRDRFAAARDKTIPAKDKRKLLKLSASVGSMSPREIARMSVTPTLEFLQEFGFGDEAIDRFFRPLLGGLLLDRDLQTDVRQFAYLWSMMEQGQTAIPAQGIEALAAQIVEDIPRYLFRFGNRVSEILRDDRGHACGVRLDTTEVIEASEVVIATTADQAAHLLGQETVDNYKSATCLYFETATPCVEGPYLAVNGTGSGIVNHIAPLTNVSPAYAPTGKHLASVTVLNDAGKTDEELAEIVKEEISQWITDKGVNIWRFIRAYRIDHAQMAQAPGFLEKLPNNATPLEGVYQAGEFTSNPSIDGAVKSGLECAALLLSEREATEAA